MSQDLLISFSLVILVLPLAGFVALIFLGKRLPRQGDWLETAAISSALVLAFVVLVQKLTNYADATLALNFTWIDFGNVPGIGPLKIVLGFSVDNLAAIMLVVVTIVSALVHFFSIGYMHGDVRYSRYFAYLGLFSFSMLLIVLANNLFLLYVGWELVGLSSYLLIGHWYEKKSASDAAMKAFIVNRIGDIGFFTGIMILFATFHTFGLQEIFDSIKAGTIPHGSEGWLTAAGILIFCGAVGKSAQFPLHVWLPDAMEGPTPVSALIHAATMVAAGVYLVARTFPMMTADALVVIAYVGAVTAFISATIAIAQNDIKKVLAYSTISQLGYMVMGLGVGAYTAGFFHLTTHAMFKAGLFLGSGSVIHAMHHALHHQGDHHTDAQDIRNMGGLKSRMPVTYWTFITYTLAISGIPLTSGFLSKDAILAGTLAFSHLTGHVLIPIIGFFVAGLTAFYMFRVVFLTFHGEHKEPHRLEHIHESPRIMTVPLMIFAVLSFFVWFSWSPLSADNGWIVQATQRPESIVPASSAAMGPEAFAEEVHHQHTTALALSLTVALLGIIVATVVYKRRKIDADKVAAALPGVHKFLLNKWYFDELYNGLVVGGTLAWTNLLRWFDNTVIDGIVNGAGAITKVGSYVSGKFDSVVVDGFVNLTAYASGFGGLMLRKFQTGKVQTYIVFVVVSVMVFYFVFRMI
ncbi:MAG: NADH-quinone oxidoreductase subunit L [Ignavibacteriae bacterium]|nr:NADH-quinone oxidoreductase subunit L [Ignavibacteriota bacterium]